MNTFLLHHLPLASAAGTPAAPALTYTGKTLSYGELAGEIESLAGGLVHLGLGRGERVGIYLEKRFEFVVAAFGAAAAGGVFVPLNPLLKAEQVGYILADCAVRILITSAERFEVLRETLAACHDLRRVIVIGKLPAEREHLPFALESWSETLAGPRGEPHRVIDTDVVSILYTSGSTGRPKGVVLSHRNMVAGAKSVASYLKTAPTTPCSPPCPCPSTPASAS